MAIVLILFLLVIASASYVAFIIRKKGIDPKDIRINSLQDAKKLLQLPPNGAGPHRYLQKRA
ncbi:uncharacterized protein LOC117588865 [Drosophila guanche]|uniref:uncharacterized protein LOC117588865 n=1 Tax=Drosophila guanche TaxID=7266 RepID=UPI001470D85B|nr:uncharacterized protein LOC117588865 [Drosophila guanche]